MRERAVTLTLETWLQTAGPKALCHWLASTAEDLAIKDLANWRDWAETADIFRDIARALPVKHDCVVDLADYQWKRGAI
jgi:hypothetical protein